MIGMHNNSIENVMQDIVYAQHRMDSAIRYMVRKRSTLDADGRNI